MLRLAVSIWTSLLMTAALVGCNSTSAELRDDRGGRSLLCESGKLGQAINSTGKVPDGCVKIEGDEIGATPQSLELDGITVELTGWESKDGEAGEYVGFTIATTGGSVVFAVKAGTETWAGSGTSWTHPKGKSGPEARGISNITFCPAEPGSGSNPDGGLTEPGNGNGDGDGEGEGGNCTPEPVTEGGSPGSACAENGDCASNLCVNQLCEAGGPGNTPGGALAPCNAALDCATRACVNGACSDPNGPSTGESCSSDGACYSGSCQSSFCEGNGPGEPCRQPSDCAAGSTCEDGVCESGGSIG